MNVKIISCWFATSYGAYTNGLRLALEHRLSREVGIIASNCGCGDPIAARRQFQDHRCEYFEFPNVKYYRSTSRLKYWLRTQARQLVGKGRVRLLQRHSGDAEVLHFQQILNATGSITVFNWLRLPSKAARVITVHELDPDQTEFEKSNREYNRADRIIVHAEEMKKKLISLGVDGNRIDVVEHGVDIRPLADAEREGIIFYGGHRLNGSKGLDTLLAALRRVQETLGASAPKLNIFGHWGDVTPEFGLEAVAKAGMGDSVRWLNQLDLETTISHFQRSLLCVLPYTGSFAGYAAGLAMAHGVPVIATRLAGLPDHLGDTGVWVEPNNSEDLARAIVALVGDGERRRELAANARARAEKVLSWDAIAEKTISAYEKAIRHKAGARSVPDASRQSG